MNCFERLTPFCSTIPPPFFFSSRGGGDISLGYLRHLIYFEVSAFSVCHEVFCSYTFYTTKYSPRCFQMIAQKKDPIKYSKMKKKNCNFWWKHTKSHRNSFALEKLSTKQPANTEMVTQQSYGPLLKFLVISFPFCYLDVFQWALYDTRAFSNCIALLSSKFFLHFPFLFPLLSSISTKDSK